MLGDFEHEEIDDEATRHFSVQWERLYPCEVGVRGEVQGQTIEWLRALSGPNGRTISRGAAKIKKLESDV